MLANAPGLFAVSGVLCYSPSRKSTWAGAQSEGMVMNSLFLAALTLFFAQGLVGRDKWTAKLLATVAMSSTAVASVYLLGYW